MDIWNSIGPKNQTHPEMEQDYSFFCAIGLAIDPLFFYVLSISKHLMCIYLDGKFVVLVTVLHSTTDPLHLWHIWLQLRLAYVSKESLVVGSGKLVWDAHLIALHYLRSLKAFWFDIFVIVPLPQVVVD